MQSEKALIKLIERNKELTEKLLTEKENNTDQASKDTLERIQNLEQTADLRKEKIQGLKKIIEEQKKRLDQKEQEIQDLETRVENLQPQPSEETEQKEKFGNVTEKREEALKHLEADNHTSSREIADRLNQNKETIKSRLQSLRKIGLAESVHGTGFTLTEDGEKYIEENLDTERESEDEDSIEEFEEVLDSLPDSDIDRIELLKNTSKMYTGINKIAEAAGAPEAADSYYLRPFIEKDMVEAQRGAGIKITEKGEEFLEYIDEENISVDSRKEKEKVRSKYDEEIDGQTQYDWYKRSLKKMIPEKGETEVYVYEDFIKHFTGRDSQEDQDAWMNIIQDKKLQNVILRDLGLGESVSIEFTQASDHQGQLWRGELEISRANEGGDEFDQEKKLDEWNNLSSKEQQALMMAYKNNDGELSRSAFGAVYSSFDEAGYREKMKKLDNLDLIKEHPKRANVWELNYENIPGLEDEV